jgi:flavin reductase (DIM6/NTAB) family NADH-FMN oxidoreductase RutF
MVLGRVLGVHIRDEVLRDGLVDLNRIKPIARLGYMDYTLVETIFAMQRPGA